MKLLRQTLIAFTVAIFLLANPLVAFAATLAEQTNNFSSQLNVWQAIQELGSNLNGKAGAFTFRVSTSRTNLNQFDYTAQNSRIYDKSNNSFITGCIPSGANPADPLRGLIFNTNGVPTGYEDVSIDFSCNNYNFTADRRYLIFISNANMGNAGSGKILFAATSYGANSNLDYFTGGGVRYGNGNQFDYANNGGSCNPVNYIWNSQTNNSGCVIFSSTRDDLYFTLTDTPPTLAPTPFLDLPWDYQGKGFNFNEAAIAINSYFDHEYPLLSSGLGEPNVAIGTTTTFRGEFRTKFEYSSHDGYDYGIPANVSIGDPVLAAADGVATLGDKSKCWACGNYILIDHGNGYQTRYYHMVDGSPIITQLGQSLQVKKGQQIGKVGATGNVSSPGSAGAHIHFMVVQDKNRDGNFDDNIPDGVTDPFGWQSKETDPWENYAFFYSGQNRTGNKSYYLWTKKLDNLDPTLTSNGGVFKTSRATFNFPAGATNQNLNVNIKSSPIVKVGDTLASIGSTIVATAQDIFGNVVTQFQALFTLTIDFNGFDLSRYKTGTISIYSSQDGINWQKESTTVDMNNKTATAQIDHFTQFALMAERADAVPPTTTVNLSGTQGHPNWFRSDVQTTLNAQDNDGGLGVDYILYRINSGQWQQYTSSLNFSSEGHQKLEFYSVDKDENGETVKSVEFDIDKTPPESRIRFDTSLPDIVITGKDNSGPTRITKQNIQDKQQFIINDRAGNTLTLTASNIEHGQNAKISLESLKYNDQPEIKLDNNQLRIEDNLQADLRTLTQEFNIDGQPSIKLEYSTQTNKTVITITHNGQVIQTKEMPGMLLLKLNTEKGTLKYSYSL